MDLLKKSWLFKFLKKKYPNDTDLQIEKKASWSSLIYITLNLIFFPFVGVLIFLMFAPLSLSMIVNIYFNIKKPKITAIILYALWLAHLVYTLQSDEYPLVMALLEVNLALFFPDFL